MFLRVWPDKPLEGVYFEVSFKDNLGSDVDVPQTWLNQLQCAIQSGLEPPQSALAFDKSVWAVCLLQIVHFKMAEQLVSCIFIDGTQIDFPLRCNHAARLLYTIIADSREAMEATRMEQVRDAALMRSKRASSPMMRPLSPVKPTTTSKHRKHRSLLVSLISYVDCLRISSCTYGSLLIFSLTFCGILVHSYLHQHRHLLVLVLAIRQYRTLNVRNISPSHLRRESHLAYLRDAHARQSWTSSVATSYRNFPPHNRLGVTVIGSRIVCYAGVSDGCVRLFRSVEGLYLDRE